MKDSLNKRSSLERSPSLGPPVTAAPWLALAAAAKAAAAAHPDCLNCEEGEWRRFSSLKKKKVQASTNVVKIYPPV